MPSIINIISRYMRCEEPGEEPRVKIVEIEIQ
jgi:hypothetical protein